MNRYTQLISNYLEGKLSPSEKAEFESRLKTNAELKAEFELQRQLVDGIRKSGIKAEITKGFKKGRFKARAGTVVKAIVITGLTVAVVLAIANTLTKKDKDNIRYELNEENKKLWSDADRYLTPETFVINGARDTVIETKGGIIYSIPARAFLDNKGDEITDGIELEVKEAFTPLEIMKAGLSTTSDEKLLETGGMFYLNARKDGTNLTIAANKGIYASIPNINPNKNMMLFEGQRTAAGKINWVKPRAFENNLPTVDIQSLNFYPPNFLDSLKKFGFDVKNKKLTDSIYYSFTCGSQPAPQYTEADFAVNWYADSIQEPDGAKLFRQNCAVCHATDNRMLTGPGLGGIMARVPKPAIPWLTKYIQNNEKVLKSGDAYANKIYNDYGKAAMTVFEGQLSERDVLAIINYINSNAPKSVFDTGKSPCEIAPSRIRAIWNNKFNNTLLATKAFEERLQAIFKTCNGGILDLYVKNMDKKMYQLDSMASEMLVNEWEMYHVFYNFYLRKDGGVKISDGRLKKLYTYMNEKQQLYEEATRQSIQKLYEKENLQNQQALVARLKQSKAEAERYAKTLNEELEVNLDEAYRQLGKPRPPRVPAQNGYLSTTIATMGWKNVDAYVAESTVKRSTLDYTDPETGKKANIKYQALEITVVNYKDFDRVLAYLLPDQLSSFQRMQNTGNLFKENLNELFAYRAIVIGFKGNSMYGATLNTAKPGKTSVTLSKMSESDLSLPNTKSNNAMWDVIFDTRYQKSELQENERNQIIYKREVLRGKLWPVVFPCGFEQ